MLRVTIDGKVLQETPIGTGGVVRALEEAKRETQEYFGRVDQPEKKVKEE